MKSFRFLFVTIAIAVANVASTALADAMPCHAKQELCSFFQGYIDAFNTRDWERFRATFAEDISVMFDRPIPPERRDGRASVEEVFRGGFPAPGQPSRALPRPIEPQNLLVQELGESAVISFHLRGPGEVARRTVVLRKTKKGWRVIHIHASSYDWPAQ